jgi:transmembrane sensor
MPSTPSMKDLLEKYLEGEATPEERMLVEQWFELIGKKQGAGEKPIAALSDLEKEELFTSLHRSHRFRNARRRKIFLLQPSWKAAAVWSGLLLGGWGIFQAEKSGKGGKSQQTAFVEVATGRAEVRKIRLPDSSEVWLNANTVVRYAADFRENRQVRLDGEALFEVAHHQDHPFTVETPDGLRTEVLGTRFDIKSYDRLPVSEVSVINGRIRVSYTDRASHSGAIAGVLTEGQAVTYFRKDGNTRRSDVAHPESLSGWITGDWEFDNKGVGELSLLLNNQFGVNLVCRRPDLEETKITVNFNSRQTAREMIDIFCAFTESQSRWKDSSTVEIY